MRLTIDTNIYAALKSGSMHIRELLEKADEILVPVTVLGELYAGFQIGRLTEKNMNELDEFLSKPGISVIEIDKDTSFRYGFLIKELRKQGTPIPSNDVWIAASVMDTGSILVSRDKHFKNVPGLLVMDC